MNASARWSGRIKWLLGLTAFLLLAALGVAGFNWLRSTPVPEIPLEGLDIELAEAIKKARAAVVKAPRSADAWGHLGRVLLVNESFLDIAFVCFQEAERLDPEEPRWPYFSGGLLAGVQGKPEEAAPKLERAAALAEGTPGAPSAPRLFLAETLASLGQIEQAAGQFKKVLASEPNNPRAHFGLALLAYARGDWPACRTSLEACRGIPQIQKKVFAHLATVCERLGDKGDADKYAKLVARLPNDSDWIDPYVQEHLNLAVRKRDRFRAVENLEKQGFLESAANYLRPMISDYPDDYHPHLMMGRIKGQLGHFSEAEQHLLKAQQILKAQAKAPDNLQLHYLLSLVLLGKGEVLLDKKGDPLKTKAWFEESAKSARQALAIRPDYGYAHMSLGRALKHLGKRADSLAELRQAVHCNPEYAENHLYLGQALEEEGDTVAARYHLEQALLLAPANDPRYKAALDKLALKSVPQSK